jgi:post-segregation antitoxin (ccd killing protein)
MKTNITLKVDRDLLRRARVLAAEKDTSVSALVTEQLEKAVREREGYDQAKKYALAAMKKGFNLGYKGPASRDELHER